MVFRVFLVLALIYEACSNVIGIDFGTEYFKVSLVKAGRPFQMVENIQSKSKTPNYLAFKDNEILYGADALTKKIRFSEAVFSNVQEFIGRKFDDPRVKKFLSTNMVNFEIKQEEVCF